MLRYVICSIVSGWLLQNIYNKCPQDKKKRLCQKGNLVYINCLFKLLLQCPELRYFVWSLTKFTQKLHKPSPYGPNCLVHVNLHSKTHLIQSSCVKFQYPEPRYLRWSVSMQTSTNILKVMQLWWKITNPMWPHYCLYLWKIENVTFSSIVSQVSNTIMAFLIWNLLSKSNYKWVELFKQLRIFILC
jgi:hypothetical protein